MLNYKLTKETPLDDTGCPVSPTEGRENLRIPGFRQVCTEDRTLNPADFTWSRWDCIDWESKPNRDGRHLRLVWTPDRGIYFRRMVNGAVIRVNLTSVWNNTPWLEWDAQPADFDAMRSYDTHDPDGIPYFKNVSEALQWARVNLPTYYPVRFQE